MGGRQWRGAGTVLAGMLVSAIGCGPAVDAAAPERATTGGQDGTTGGTGVGSAVTTAAASTSGDAASTSGSSGSSGYDDSGGNDSSPNGSGYCGMPLVSARPLAGSSSSALLDIPWSDECSFWEQDCPRGEKCAIWQSIAACAPIEPDPALPGEVCERYACGDECDATSWCFRTPGESTGVCRPFCTGTAEAPQCPRGSRCAGALTTAASAEWLPVCLAECDPLVDDCGDPSTVCTLSAIESAFVCLPTNEIYGPLEDCSPHSPYGVCDSGWHCVEEAGGNLCRRLCELEAAEPCPALGQICAEAFDDPDLAHLGVCM